MDRLSEYDYHLPAELIAQTALEDRSGSRLLHLTRKSGQITHRRFIDVVDMLQPNDLLVVNNTEVTARRIFGNKPSGGNVELLLLREVEPGQYESLVRPAKRLKAGAEIRFDLGIKATVVKELDEGKRLINFHDRAAAQEFIRSTGQIPLPPYIQQELRDDERYQTVYASQPGSAAAPTAGLHFTEEILRALSEKGVQRAEVNLSVDIDTFRPVMTENLAEHQMHGETCHISEKAAQQINNCSGRIIAVGTTSVRTLESFATGHRQVEAGTKQTKIFIRPGFSFNIIDGMFTNFHMPKTSMLVMLSAFASREQIFRAYDEAINEKYRFLSFGDSMLIL